MKRIDTARKILLLLAVLATAGCHRRVVVETVERTVLVHDTILLERAGEEATFPLDEALEEVLRQEEGTAREAGIGFAFLDLDGGTVLAARNEAQRMRTASVMKAVTAITALSTVESIDSAFLTRVISDGKDAWVRGGWDPLLSQADVEALARKARASIPRQAARGKGMAAQCPVRVDLKGQDAARYGRGWCWDDHNPLLTPLFYSPATDMRKRHPIDRPEQDFIDAFARAWRKAPAGTGKDCDSTVTLAVVSRPLPQVLAPMLKNSDNLMAEAVWRLTGESEQQRQQALAAVATAAGVDEGGISQADGSGLSLYNYASPLSLVRLLAWAHGQPFAATLRSCLPCMGVDGTLRNRRVHGARVEAKTGTVEGVITLAGYMTLTDGQQLAFAIMINGIRDKVAARAIRDRLLETVALRLVRP